MRANDTAARLSVIGDIGDEPVGLQVSEPDRGPRARALAAAPLTLTRLVPGRPMISGEDASSADTPAAAAAAAAAEGASATTCECS